MCSMAVLLILQLICKTPFKILVLGRTASQVCQWAMTLYSTNTGTFVSPLAITVLGSVAFFFSMMDILIDMCFHTRDVRDHAIGQGNGIADHTEGNVV